MSFPTRQFQNLSIGERMVPLSRSQAQRLRRQRERMGRERVDAPQQSHTGLLYDLRQLSPATRDVASRGLQAEAVRAESVMRKDWNETEFYYAFKLSERSAVRLDPRHDVQRVVSCSCSEFTSHWERDSATAICKHIYVSDLISPDPTPLYHEGLLLQVAV